MALISKTTWLKCQAAIGGVMVLLLLAACEEPNPTSYAEFMEDSIARDGTLIRCNLDRENTTNDIECANARRAAATIALREERERREVFEQESERKLAVLRAEVERERAAAREAQALAEAAAKAAYDAQWEGQSDQPIGVDGLPIGADNVPSDAAAALNNIEDNIEAVPASADQVVGLPAADNGAPQSVSPPVVQ